MKWEDIGSAEQLERIPEDAIFAQIESHTQLLAGPPDFAASQEQAILICNVKNGDPYLQAFLAHYRKLGISHFFFLDNGSEDGTISFLSDQPDVSIYQTMLPFKVYRVAFKQFMVHKLAANSWTLVVDVDEFFDYPFSEWLSLSQLLRYLNQQNYTALVTQMLDLFSKSKIGTSNQDQAFQAHHRYYDLTGLIRRPYLLDNAVSNPAIAFFHGGIRNKAFGLDKVYLTKHALFYAGEHVRMDHEHWVSGARVADFSVPLFHYKFLDHFPAYVRDAVEKEYHYGNSKEYKAYLPTIEAGKKLSLWTETSKELKQISQLYADHFLVISEAFLKYVRQHIGAKDQKVLDTFLGELQIMAASRFDVLEQTMIDSDIPFPQKKSFYKDFMEASQRLQDMEKSLSWRMTAPLRYFADMSLRLLSFLGLKK